MLKGANSRDVVAGVKDDRSRRSTPYLPSGRSHRRRTTTAPSSSTASSRRSRRTSAKGAIIVVVCLLLTLGSLRAGLLVAGAIPFAMLVGFIGLNASATPATSCSLGAIDFGIVVEGAVRHRSSTR